jgi:hypothetical protein
MPKKSPYFPQINDEVVYIPFGHKLYNEEVKRRRLYKITNTNKYIKSHFDTKVIAKVVQIKFVIESNIRLVILSLREMSSKTSISTNKQFNVRYHDMENVIDFIVLRKCYESSYSTTKWKPGDQFRAIVDDKWWFGTIKGYNLNNELAKNTFFQLYWIQWANNQTELLSMWDLEKINGILPKNRRRSVDITHEEREQFYTSDANEWPLCGKCKECERIAEGLDSKNEFVFNYFSYICLKVFFFNLSICLTIGLDIIMKFKESEKFVFPVDLAKNEFYARKIAYPLSLSIIKSRVKNHFYRRLSAIKFDLTFIHSNACILDSENSDFVRNSKIVTAVCLKFIDDCDCRDPNIIYNEVMADKNKIFSIKNFSFTRNYVNLNERQSNSPNTQNNSFNFSNLNMPSTSGLQFNNSFSLQSNETEVITLSDDTDDESSGLENNQQIDNRIEDRIEVKKEVSF